MKNVKRFSFEEIKANSIEEAINTIKIVSIRKKALQVYNFVYAESKVDYYLSFSSSSLRGREGKLRQEQIIEITERFVNYCLDRYQEHEFESPQFKSNMISNIYRSITTKAKVKKGKVKMANQKGK